MDRQGKSIFGLEAQQNAVQAFAKANAIKLYQEFNEIKCGKKNARPILDSLGRNVAFIATL